MAPVGQSDHDVIEKQLKDVIQDLYQMMIQVNSYDQTARPSKDVLENTIKKLHQTLTLIHTTTSSSSSTIKLPSIPPELMQYVDNGRNPDIYTRELVEATRKSNQVMRGKTEAFASFRDVLAQQMRSALPELRDDVDEAVRATGGVVAKGEGEGA